MSFLSYLPFLKIDQLCPNFFNHFFLLPPPPPPPPPPRWPTHLTCSTSGSSKIGMRIKKLQTMKKTMGRTMFTLIGRSRSGCFHLGVDSFFFRKMPCLLFLIIVFYMNTQLANTIIKVNKAINLVFVRKARLIEPPEIEKSAD